MTAEDEQAIRECFADAMYFDAAKLGVPSLREELWAASGSSYAESLDHGRHELSDVRIASPDEIRESRLWGDVKSLFELHTWAPREFTV